MPRTAAPSLRVPSDCLRVGACRVDVPLREVHAPDARRPVRITPKTMGVLLVLTEQAGRVVSRDALLAQVWPDTLPTNDVVTQAITQLRKAFGEDRGTPRYIETIAKTGYRLLAPVEWLEATSVDGPAGYAPVDGSVPVAEAPAPMASDARAAPAFRPGAPAGLPVREPRGTWRAVLAAMVMVAMVVGLTALWSISRDTPVAPARPAVATDSALPPLTRPAYRLVTSAPGFEVTPTLSPDASLVAYVALPAGSRGTAIFVQTTMPSAPRQLTAPPAGSDDVTPQWSPDGRELAFLRVDPHGACSVRVMPLTGGDGRVVGRCDPRNVPGFDWTPDGRGLVFGSRGTPADGPGLHVLDLASGDWRAVPYPASAGDIDAAPRYSPDGRWIVFVRNGPLGDFWRVPARGGVATPLTRMRADIGGWDFTPDGQAIIFARWHDSESRLYRLDLGSRTVRELGITDGVQPVLAARTPALAFSQQRNYFGLYRFGRDGHGQRLFPSSGRDRLPAVAPDGQQLVFASDRSGEFGLWWADLERPGSLRLIEGVLPESRHLPEWSPDSQRLLVVGTGPDGAGGLYEIQPASGRVTALPVPAGDPVQAAYLPGPAGRNQLLVVAGTESGRLRLSLYDRARHPWRVLATLDDVSGLHVDRSGQRILFTRADQAGLWQADLSLSPSSVRLVDAERPVALRYRQWNVGPGGAIELLERTADCGAMLFRSSGDRTAPRCLDQTRLAAINGLSIGPDGDVFVSLSETLGGDIGFMMLGQPPSRRSWGPDK